MKRKAKKGAEVEGWSTTRKTTLWIGGGVLFLLLALAASRLLVGSSPVSPGAGGQPLTGVTGARPSDDEFLSSIRRGSVYEDNGKYILGPEFLDIFNEFRAQYIDQGKSVLLQAFADWAKDNYSIETAHLLVNVFTKYLTYLERLSAPGFLPAGASMDQKFHLIQALRNEIFGEEIARALFRFQDERIQFAMALQAIQSDPNLTDAQKKAKINAFRDSLPADKRGRLFPTDPDQEYHEKLDALKKETADLPPEEQAQKIRELRMKMFGPEATKRLEDLDRVRTERAARMDVYNQEKAKIMADPSLSDAERAKQIDLLQQDVLRPEQQRRVRALDALGKISNKDITKAIEAVQNGQAPAPDLDNPVEQGANIPAPDGKK